MCDGASLLPGERTSWSVHSSGSPAHLAVEDPAHASCAAQDQGASWSRTLRSYVDPHSTPQEKCPVKGQGSEACLTIDNLVLSCLVHHSREIPACVQGGTQSDSQHSTECCSGTKGHTLLVGNGKVDNNYGLIM